jgi:prophage regulatory protein
LQQLSSNEQERRAAQNARDRILRDAEVGDRTGLSRTTRWRLIREGKFPRPLKLTEHGAIGWRQSSIDAWVASREAA